MRRYIALIPAAGVGLRFGAGKPKQYVEIAGKTVLQHTLDVFLSHASIDKVALVLSPDDAVFQTGINQDKLLVLRVGGETRAESVRNGVRELLQQGWAQEEDNILVHDAARCCLSTPALERLIEQAGERSEGGILAVPVADTLKRAGDGGHIGHTVERAGLWQAQTPQLFRAALLLRALSEKDLSKVTDEASAVEALGIKPLLVEGESSNLKLTLPQDEIIVRLLLESRGKA